MHLKNSKIKSSIDPIINFLHSVHFDLKIQCLINAADKFNLLITLSNKVYLIYFDIIFFLHLTNKAINRPYDKITILTVVMHV